MGLLDFFKSSKEKETIINGFKQPPVDTDPNSGGPTGPAASWDYRPSYRVRYDGEKTPGEIGAIKDYLLDYGALRARSWQSLLESEVTQTIIKKYVLWIISGGLKLQSEPISEIIEDTDPAFNKEDFVKSVETNFKVYSKSKQATHSKQKSLNRISKTAFKNAIVGGDVLVILRTEKGVPTVQLVDGYHVATPRFNLALVAAAERRGNKVRHGVEINSAGEHVAYFVRESFKSEKRVLAKGKKTGRVQAYLVYGSEYRIDDIRGVPLIVAVLESLKKLDRYKEATIGSAEERQKIPYFITHDKASTGENPLTERLSKSLNLSGGDPDSANAEIGGEASADTKETIAFTTQKQVFNLPIDSDIKSFDANTGEINFKDFYDRNFAGVCAAIGIPPEVALSMYNSNYSASRVATKDWEHTIMVNRADFTEQYYQPIYNLWLELSILSQRIPSNGYLSALASKDFMLIESYQMARFIGPGVPSIDPLKEVKAVRAKLGPLYDNVPLMTGEQATEEFSAGDYSANLEKAAQELEEASEFAPEEEEIIPENVE